MAMELRQEVKMTQQLRMTPQLQQAIKLLQLSRMELISTVRQEMAENPVLEEVQEPYESESLYAQEHGVQQDRASQDKTEEVRADERDVESVDWDNFVEYYSTPMPNNSYRGYSGEEMPSYEQTLSTSESLTEHLMIQLRLAGLDETETYIGTLIIGNLDEAGYLTGATVEDIARDAGAPVESVEQVLAVVQEFDPAGVAGRDLRESLLIQIRKRYPKNEMLYRLVDEHIPNLERKSYGKIARDLGITTDEVIEGAKLVASLEPKPGRIFHNDNARYITPDIYIYRMGDDYVAVLNEDGLPKLKISSYYRQELARKRADGERDEVKDYIQDKLRGAMFLIRSIHQRQSTILKVTESIIKFQQDFFEKGVEHLKPLVLRDVAEDIEMHESTVSRVTTNKYVHTPRGVFELKYFFNSSITKLGGEDLASEAVKAKIREIIANENPQKPYSDSKIVTLLRQQQIDIARRTVAKYREMMGILSSTQRKCMF